MNSSDQAQSKPQTTIERLLAWLKKLRKAKADPARRIRPDGFDIWPELYDYGDRMILVAPRLLSARRYIRVVMGMELLAGVVFLLAAMLSLSSCSSDPHSQSVGHVGIVILICSAVAFKVPRISSMAFLIRQNFGATTTVHFDPQEIWFEKTIDRKARIRRQKRVDFTALYEPTPQAQLENLKLGGANTPDQQWRAWIFSQTMIVFVEYEAQKIRVAEVFDPDMAIRFSAAITKAESYYQDRREQRGREGSDWDANPDDL